MEKEESGRFFSRRMDQGNTTALSRHAQARLCRALGRDASLGTGERDSSLRAGASLRPAERGSMHQTHSFSERAVRLPVLDRANVQAFS